MLNFQNYLKKLIRTICIWLVIFFVFTVFLGTPHWRLPFSKDDGAGYPYLGFGGVRKVERGSYPNTPPLFMLLPMERSVFLHLTDIAAGLWKFSFGSHETAQTQTP